MRKLYLVVVFLVALSSWPAFGQSCTNSCFGAGGYGHASTHNGGTAPTAGGVDYPYTEDIATSCSDNGYYHKVVNYDSTWATDSTGGFVKIWSGCPTWNETNINASGAINLVIHSGVTITAATASAGTLYEVQVRVGTSISQVDNNTGIVASWDSRRLGGTYNQNDRFGAIVKNLSSGDYVVAMYARVLGTGSMTVDSQYITAEGIPTTYPADGAAASGDISVSTSWAAAGPQLTFTNSSTVDVVIGSAFQIVNTTTAGIVYLGYSVDGGSSGNQYGPIHVNSTLPMGVSAFDAKTTISPGTHTLQAFMKTDTGSATVRYFGIQYATEPNSPSMVISPVSTGTITVDAATTEAQPQGSLNDGNGKWTKLLEFNVPPSSGDNNWQLEGFLESLGNLSSGASTWVQIAIEANHYNNLDGSGNPINYDASSDMGVFSLVPKTGTSASSGEGFYFYGDSFRWGNSGGGNVIKVWIRRVFATSGTFDVGKRWLAVKLLPSPGTLY